MTKFEIAKEYMNRRFPSKAYTMREGNNCVWVSMGIVDMYLTIRDNMVIDLQVD